MTAPFGTDDYLSSTAPGDHDRIASYRPEEPLAWSLDGHWKFSFSATTLGLSSDAWGVDLDDQAWEEIEVPSHFVLTEDHRWGAPIYTNVQFPIPMDPPFVPDANLTGDYRREFWLPGGDGLGDVSPGEGWQSWEEFEKVLLRFDGIESIGLVHLNGERVGVVRGSRLRSELDVTDLLRPGHNVLHIRVHQWSAMTYVEDQDQWWLPGIFRSVSLVGRPVGGIDDVWLRTDYDPATGKGFLAPEIQADDAAWPVRVEIGELGLDVNIASREELELLDVGQVEPWDCDSPRLYTVLVSNEAEAIELRTGFRTVRVEGRELLVNDRPVRMRGVNRHEFDADRGRIVSRERALEDLKLMKRSGMNTVRTAHYPPAADFLDLCDEIGLFVVLENDLETHGFEAHGWVGNPSDDPSWTDHLLDRMRRTVERDKNHPSIIIWSLGNESGNGANLAAMAAWTRRRDPGRPVHYEGDHEGAYTDLVSRMYEPVEGLAKLSAGIGVAQSPTVGAASRQIDRPVMLCEYVHAMGTGPGGVEAYERAFDLPGIIGGLVWEWRDHGLRTHVNGQDGFAYGGDFGETVHDGKFVIDGLTGPDGDPHPGLSEVAANFTPIRLKIEDGELEIVNLRHSADTSDLTFTVSVNGANERDERRVISVSPIAAGDRVSVPLDVPAAGDRERWLTVEASLSDDAAWADAGFVVARAQMVVPAATKPAAPSLLSAIDDWGFGSVALDPRDGRLIGWNGQEVREADVTLWRAPTSNDSLGDFGSYELGDVIETGGFGVRGPSSEERWRAAGLDRLMSRLVDIERSADAITIRRRYMAAQSAAGVNVVERWTMQGDTPRLAIDIVPVGRLGTTWPRVGWHLLLPSGYDEAAWAGFGPGEAYSDMGSAAWLGNFEAPIDDLCERTVVPQFSGHRPGLRGLTLSSGDVPELRLHCPGPEYPGFTLSRHSDAELDVAQHRSELAESSGVHLTLDAHQHGIGTRSCGPDVRPQHQLWPIATRINVEFPS